MSAEIQTIESALPSVLRTKSLTVKFVEEVKRFHRWLGIIFHYSDAFPRVLRITSISTTIIIQLFVQAVTYKLANPNDGSCELLTTESACLAPRSPFSSSTSKCYWAQGYKLGQCHFREPASSVEVVLYVAMFCAVLGTPLAIGCEWIVMNILSAKTLPYRSRAVTTELEAVQFNHRRSARGAFIRRATIDNGDRPREDNAEDATEDGVLTLSLDDELAQLTADMSGYRNTLTPAQRSEFDELWGLNAAGGFVSAADIAARQNNMYRFMSSSNAVDVKRMVRADLMSVRSKLLMEFGNLTTSVRSIEDKTKRLLYLFQRDLMPAVNGRIMDAKNDRDSEKRRVLSAEKKLLGWVLIALFNLALIFYVFLFAMQTTKQRQAAWLKTFVVYLIMDIVFVSTAVVVITHMVIPMLTMRDIAKIKEKMVATIRAHVEATRRAARYEDDGGDSKEAEPNREFNAADYLFLSFRLAKMFPNLRSSAIILRYNTVWPKQSYNHQLDVSKTYSSKYTALNKAIMTIIMSLLSSAVSLPPSIHDIIIKCTSTATIGYAAILHMRLFKIYPALVVLPSLLILVIVHFMVKGGTAKARGELAKLMPVEEKPPRAATTIAKVRKTEQLPVTSTGRVFMNRRQSLAAGHDLVQTMLSEQANVDTNKCVVPQPFSIGDADDSDSDSYSDGSLGEKASQESDEIRVNYRPAELVGSNGIKQNEPLPPRAEKSKLSILKAQKVNKPTQRQQWLDNISEEEKSSEESSVASSIHSRSDPNKGSESLEVKRLAVRAKMQTIMNRVASEASSRAPNKSSVSSGDDVDSVTVRRVNNSTRPTSEAPKGEDLQMTSRGIPRTVDQPARADVRGSSSSVASSIDSRSDPNKGSESLEAKRMAVRARMQTIMNRVASEASSQAPNKSSVLSGDNVDSIAVRRVQKDLDLIMTSPTASTIPRTVDQPARTDVRGSSNKDVGEKYDETAIIIEQKRAAIKEKMQLLANAIRSGKTVEDVRSRKVVTIGNMVSADTNAVVPSRQPSMKASEATKDGRPRSEGAAGGPTLGDF